MKLKGIQKLTLLDFPGRVACTVFTGGCDMRCPFCHNGGLVLRPGDSPDIDGEEVLSFLKKRRGILEGVCITGGEPTLCPGLEEFMARVKDMGYLVKLDTNGAHPKMLRSLLERGLADYAAVDIKNSLEKYPQTVGIPGFDTAPVEETVSLLVGGGWDYEFRTTIVRELHSPEDIRSIGELIRGARRYFLQSYRESPNVIRRGFSPCSAEVLVKMAAIAGEYVPAAELRGVDLPE